MKTYKEQADELIESYNSEDPGICWKSHVEKRIETLIQAGEYFVGLMGEKTAGIFLKKEWNEIQESITKLKESIK